MGSGALPGALSFGSLTGHPPGRRMFSGRVQYCSDQARASLKDDPWQLLKKSVWGALIWRPLLFAGRGSDPTAVLLDRAWTAYPGSALLKNLEIPSRVPMLCLALRECCTGGGRSHRPETMEANRIEAAVSVAAMRVILGHVDASSIL